MFSSFKPEKKKNLELLIFHKLKIYKTYKTKKKKFLHFAIGMK